MANDFGAARSDAVDVAQVWTTLRQNLPVVMAIAAMIFGAVMAWTLLWPMQFMATGRLYLGELEERARPTGPNGDDLDLSGGSHGDFGSEIEILKSRSLVTRAILESGLNVDLRPVGWTPPRYWRWRLSGRAPALLDAASREVAAVNTSLVDRSLPLGAYDVHFVSDQEYEVRSGGHPVGGGKLGQKAQVEGLNLTLVAGDERGPAAGARYEVEVTSLDEAVDDAVKRLEASKSGKAVAGEPVKVASLQFVDPSPRMAAKFLERLMLGYLEERQSWKTEDATAAESFITAQLRGIRESLDQIQNKLAEYRSNSHVVVLDNEAKAMIEQIGKYEEQRVTARLEVEALADIQDALKGPNPPREAYMVGEAKDSVLMGLATSLAEAQQKLTEAETRFQAAAPEVRDQRAQVEAQLQAIQSYVTNRLTRARENLRTLDGIIGQYEKKLRTVPGAEVGLSQLMRESDVYSTMYSYLLKRQQEAAIVKASTVSKNRVLDPALVRYREESPKLAARLVSAPAGLLLGALFVLLRTLVAGTFQSEGDVRSHLGQFPVFATVPRCRRRARTRLVHAEAGFDGRTSSRYLEAFRTLRTNLDHGPSEVDRHVIVVTSPTDGDGKTTCALCLTWTLAMAGRSVLLVDANVRKRKTHPAPAAEGVGDLSTVLLGEDVWRNVVRPVSISDSCQFQVIGTGRAAPADLLSSARMIEFLEDARAAFEFIVIDSPSYPSVSDALVLSRTASCVLSVIRLGRTSRKLAAEHVARLSASAPIYALIINDAK